MNSIKKQYKSFCTFKNSLGFLHNEQGPSIIYYDGEESYYLYGIYYRDKSEWERMVLQLKIKQIL